ncbi:MAG: TerD family protein [Eubacteriales bacterium]
MVNFNTITQLPLNSAGLANINSGKSLPVLSANTVSTLNGWKNKGTANSTSQTINQPQSNFAAQTVAIPHHEKPAFKNPLKKGQKTSLVASSPILDIRLGLNTDNPECDVDVSAFLVGENGKVLDDSWFVFYGQPKSPDNSTNFEVLTGKTDRQKITIDTSKLNENIAKIIFVLSINEATEKALNFSMVRDAYLRILDTNESEICSYEMEDYYDNVISMVIGEIYKHNGNFKFNPVGNGMAKDLAGLCELYGVSVE